MIRLSIKRVYELPAAEDGTRILVDRLWPRGVAKEKAQIDLWLRDIAPSNELRKRFHGKPDGWGEFCRAYAAELEEPAAKAAAGELRERAKHGRVTLLFAGATSATTMRPP